ncbi:MAG: biotin transporter BioY [Treponema sp.]|nr:biotin transporter BioY [Treponema sp.]
MKIQNILVCLFAALIASGSFIQIPLFFGVPISVQDMLVILSGMLLGPFYGTLSVLLFLFMGSLGLPVFTGKGGIGILLFSPTCGFLFGYIFASFFAGLLSKQFIKYKNYMSWQTFVQYLFASIISTIVLFIFGILGFMKITESSFSKSFAICVFPFIPGNIFKIILSVFITQKLKPIVRNYL